MRDCLDRNSHSLTRGGEPFSMQPRAPVESRRRSGSTGGHHPKGTPRDQARGPRDPLRITDHRYAAVTLLCWDCRLGIRLILFIKFRDSSMRCRSRAKSAPPLPSSIPSMPSRAAGIQIELPVNPPWVESLLLSAVGIAHAVALRSADGRLREAWVLQPTEPHP